ncbi:MAG: FAD-dependent oxidoreductase [Patescibacteria group bacterium]|jgi:thioredoxin reductase (NADPH)
MPTNHYDVIIIGAGPSGLTAAIYTLRKELKTLIISPDIGGQVAITNEIENYPGFDFTSGPDLMTKMRKQAEKFGAKFVFEEAVGLTQTADGWQVKTTNSEYSAIGVILAFGLTPRSLGVPGEEKFKGRGVAFCATCDAPLYKGKTVAVVGGGNSAMEAVHELGKIAKKVYLLHRGKSFTADQVEVEQSAGFSNLEQFLSSEIVEFKGDKKLEQIVVHDLTNEKPNFELAVDGVFLEIGYITKTDWLKGVLDLNDKGEIKIDDRCVTSAAGIFAAGDVTTLAYKQIVISAGEGAKAALSAYNYISKKTGVTAPPDWGRKK